MSDLHHQVWNNFVFLGSTKNSKISIFFKRRKAFKLDPKNSFCSSMDKLDICCLCIAELTLPKPLSVLSIAQVSIPKSLLRSFYACLRLCIYRCVFWVLITFAIRIVPIWGVHACSRYIRPNDPVLWVHASSLSNFLSAPTTLLMYRPWLPLLYT